MANFTPVSAAIGGVLIGLSAVLLMLSTGRIAGISGIFSGLLNLRGEDKGWRTAFIAGLILAPVIAGLIAFVVAMAAGMIAHDIWQQARMSAQRQRLLASATDG